MEESIINNKKQDVDMESNEKSEPQKSKSSKKESVKQKNPYFGHWGEMYGYVREDAQKDVISPVLRGIFFFFFPLSMFHLDALFSIIESDQHKQ